jgi:glycosyltransferase involved in cell wall biosynthesis
MTVKKVILRAPVLTQSGYGEHGRLVLRALRSREDLFDIYIHATNWGKTSWQWEDTEERRWIDERLEKTLQYMHEAGDSLRFDISAQVTIPNEWEDIAHVNVGITAGIETTKTSPVWLEKGNIMDRIVTVSKHSADVYKNSSYDGTSRDTGEDVVLTLQTPIDVVNYPVKTFESVKELDLNLDTKFNFFSVQQWSPRKNVPQLVQAFVEQFREDEDVGLVLKANLMKNCILDRRACINSIRAQLKQYGDYKCKIHLLHGYLSEKELNSLYTHPKLHAYITTTHGEGFGLPIFEAVYNGMPVLAPDWSGQLDFLYMPLKNKKGKEKNKAMFSRISYTLGPVQEFALWPGVVEKDSMWAFPEMGSIKMNMDEIYKDYGRFKKRAKDLQKWVINNFNEKDIHEKIVQNFIEAGSFDVEKGENNA